MPLHSASRSAPKKSDTRSAVTGRQLGKAALRAIKKNASHLDDYLDRVFSAESHKDLANISSSDSYYLGRVTRQLGCGRIQVTLQDGSAEVPVPICGTITFRGRCNAPGKMGLAHRMDVGDLVVVSGGMASCRLTAALAEKVREVFDSFDFKYPRGFFAAPGYDAAADEDDDAGFEFDRSAEAEADLVAVARAKAADVSDDDEAEAVVDIDAI